MRGLLTLLLLLAAGCASTPGESATLPAGTIESVEAVLARLEATIGTNDARSQSAEVSRDFAPSYDGLLDQIRSSVQAFDVERVQLTRDTTTQDREGKTLVVDVRFDLRRRGRSSGASESVAGRTRLRYRLEGDRYRLIGQEGDALLGRP